MGEHFIGIDLGGTNIQAGVLDETGALIQRDRTKTKADQGADVVLGRIEKVIDDVLKKADLKRGDIAAIGIGAPGAVDRRQGIVIDAVNLGWRDLPLRERLEGELKRPVLVDNDVNVGTWGEHQAGAAQDYDDLLGVFVGTGIGGGLVLNGRLYHGRHHTAGEIGHTVLDADAPLGRRTLENLASRTSIVNQLVQLIESSEPSVLGELVDGDWSKVKSKALSEAVAREDALTLTVLDNAARYVGTAIANAVTLLSLPCVVVGGGLVEALGERWLDPVRTAFRDRVYPSHLGDCPIFMSRLGDDAGLIGAGLLAQAAQDGSPAGCPPSAGGENS